MENNTNHDNREQKKKKLTNWLLIGLFAVIIIFPLAFNQKAEYGGADGAAMDAIAISNPDYKPWFESIWAPPSSEIETLIFALQASLGAGFIAYYFGLMKGRKQGAANR
jgi:cobalt/nickel transport protein